MYAEIDVIDIRLNLYLNDGNFVNWYYVIPNPAIFCESTCKNKTDHPKKSGTIFKEFVG